ncbi:unnamed protein product [Allacma fusca]|uniref:C2H2-type domain-containing protein n=1 Tax=Allacma fusca TaxID=39272 RepID=A0A8J2P2B9_9HEXA|nr:unnamed protein product [Allacma fusca]
MHQPTSDDCGAFNKGDGYESLRRLDDDNNDEGAQIRRSAKRKSSSATSVYNPEAFEATPMMLMDSSSSDEEGSGESLFCYFEDDAADKRYKKVHRKDPRLWWCEICGRTFKNPKEFVSHHRRHISLELFRCPNCSVGFVNLSCCYKHEMRKHGKRNWETGSDNFQETLKTTLTSMSGLLAPCSTLASVGADDDDFACCSGTCRTVPSSCVEPYRGPALNSVIETFDIEEKFGNRSRSTTENFFRVRRKYTQK